MGKFIKPPRPDEEAAELAQEKECDAIRAVFRTQATTIAGALAQIRYVSESLRNAILDEDDENSDIHVPVLLDMIASAIEKEARHA